MSFEPCSSCVSPMACRDVATCNQARLPTPPRAARPTASNPDVVYAKNIGELQEQLKNLPKAGSWLVDRGDFGHATIMVYDADGAKIREIRNK